MFSQSRRENKGVHSHVPLPISPPQDWEGELEKCDGVGEGVSGVGAATHPVGMVICGAITTLLETERLYFESFGVRCGLPAALCLPRALVGGAGHLTSHPPLCSFSPTPLSHTEVPCSLPETQDTATYAAGRWLAVPEGVSGLRSWATYAVNHLFLETKT